MHFITTFQLKKYNKVIPAIPLVMKYIRDYPPGMMWMIRSQNEPA